MQCEERKTQYEQKAAAYNTKLKNHTHEIDQLYKGTLSQSDLNYVINN